MQIYKRSRGSRSFVEEGRYAGHSNGSGEVSKQEGKRAMTEVRSLEDIKRMIEEMKSKKTIPYEEVKRIEKAIGELLDPEFLGEEVVEKVYKKIDELFLEPERVIVYTTNELEELVGKEIKIERVKADVYAFEYIKKHPLYELYKGRESWNSLELRETLTRFKSFGGGISHAEVEEVVEQKISERVLEELERLKQELREAIREEVAMIGAVEREGVTVDEEEIIGKVFDRVIGLVDERLSFMESRIREEIREELAVGGQKETVDYSFLQENMEALLESFRREMLMGISEIVDRVSRLESEVESLRSKVDKVEIAERPSGFSMPLEEKREEEYREEGIKAEAFSSAGREEEEETVLAEVQKEEKGKRKKSILTDTKYLIYGILGLIILILLLSLIK